MNPHKLINDKEWVKKNIVSILQLFGVTDFYYISGDEIRCTCPIHGGDNNTSLVIYLDTMHYVCFSHNCHDKYGNKVFDLINTCKKNGNISKTNNNAEKTVEKKSTKKYRPHCIKQSWFQPYRQYQIQRGIQCDKTFSFKSDIVYSMYNRVVFFMYDYDNTRVKGMTGRAENDNLTPKWKHVYTRDSSHVMYYPHYVDYRNFNTCFLTEGPIDAIKVELAMRMPCIAILSDKVTYMRAKELSDHFRNIYIVPDHDPDSNVGLKGAKKTANILKEFNIKTDILSIADKNEKEKIDPGGLDTDVLKERLSCQVKIG